MTTVRREATRIRGNPIDVIGDELKVGQRAPDFTLVGQDLSDVRLADTSGTVRIISVVSSLDTGVCAAETRRWEVESASLDGVEIITVSMDLPFAQRRWVAESGVSHRVLSSYHDEEFGETWGILIKAWPLRRLLQRSVFVLDYDDSVRYVEYCQENAEPPDFERALEEARKLVEPDI